MELTETQRQAVAGKKLKMVCHLKFQDVGVLQHRNDALKVTRIVRTPKSKGKWGKQAVVWIADADPDTEHEHLAAALLCNGIK